MASFRKRGEKWEYRLVYKDWSVYTYLDSKIKVTYT